MANSRITSLLISVVVASSAALGACSGGTDGGGNGEGDGDGDGDSSSGGMEGGDGDGDLGSGGSTPTADPCGEYHLDLTDYEATSSAAEDLAPEQWGNIRQMFGFGPDLFILGADDLRVIRGESTSPEVIGTDIPELANGGYTSGRRRLVVDATHAYLTTNTGLARIDLASGSTETIWDGLVDGYTSDIWLTQTTVYFAVYGEGSGIYEVPVDGSTEPSLVTNFLEPLGFSYADGTLYSGTPGYTVASQVVGGEALTEITDYSTHIFMDPMFVTVAGERIIYSDNGDLMTCAISDCETPTALAPQATDDLVVHGMRAFWQTDSLGWTALDGTDCQNLVFGDFPDYVSIWGVTDDYVYLAGTFADVFGSVQVIRLAL